MWSVGVNGVLVTIFSDKSEKDPDFTLKLSLFHEVDSVFDGFRSLYCQNRAICVTTFALNDHIPPLMVIDAVSSLNLCLNTNQ